MNLNRVLRSMINILPIGIALVILLFGNLIYKALFVFEGKVNEFVPSDFVLTEDHFFGFGNLGATFDETSCMRLDGWATLENRSDQSLLEKVILLENDNHWYKLDTSERILSLKPGRMNDIDNWQHAGFASCLSKYFLDVGETYSVAILFRNVETGEQYIGYTNIQIKRSPNKLLVQTVKRNER